MNVAKHFVANKKDRFIDNIEILPNCGKLDMMFSNFQTGANFYYVNTTSGIVTLTQNFTTFDVTTSSASTNYSNTIINPLRIYISRGLANVKGIRIGQGSTSTSMRMKISEDIDVFLAKFPNIEQFALDIYTYGVTTGITVIKGDLAKLPNTIKKIFIGTFCVQNANTDLPLNLDSYNTGSLLESFIYGAQYSYASSTSRLKVIGDLGNLPNVAVFNLSNTRATSFASTSAVFYKKRKVWKSVFDTLIIGTVFVVIDGLTAKQQTDNLFIDMDSSIITATGNKTISVPNERSSASDVAVASLQAKGFNVTPATAT